MTELLLKNKKLLNGEVSEFIYNDEVFAYQVTNLITLFKKRYNTKNLLIHDKVLIYKFYKNNKDNSYFCKNMIKDFIELIKYLNSKKKEIIEETKEINKGNDMNITEQTKISEVVAKLKSNFANNNFINLFENNDGLTIEKTSEIFLYYLKLIFGLVKDNLKDCLNELDVKSKEFIKDYYKNEHLISKKDLTCAIRLFTTLVLFLEEDKEKKIKNNRNNLVNYLKASDLWNSEISENDDFNNKLNELKLINAQVNQTISLYEILGEDIEPEFTKDVINEIEKEEESQKQTIDEKIEENPQDEDPFATPNEQEVDDDPFANPEDVDGDEENRD